MIQPYPCVDKNYTDEFAEKEMDMLQKSIGTIRTIRSEMNIPVEKKATVIITGPEKKLKILSSHEDYVKRLASVETLHLGDDTKKPKEATTGLVGNVEICVVLEGLIDLKAERKRVGREIKRLKELLSGLNQKLNNPQFVGKAPEQVIEKEKQKQADFREKLKKFENVLHALGD